MYVASSDGIFVPKILTGTLVRQIRLLEMVYKMEMGAYALALTAGSSSSSEPVAYEA